MPTFTEILDDGLGKSVIEQVTKSSASDTPLCALYCS